MSARILITLFAAFAAFHPAPILAAPPEGNARIHYHRPKGDYDGWGLHAWEDTKLTLVWTSPLATTGRDGWGVYWDVPLKDGAKKLGFIVHKGDQKDPGADQFLDLATLREVWIVSGRTALENTPPDVSALAAGDLTRAKAHWLDRDTVVWPGMVAGAEVRLHAAPDASLKLGRDGITGGESFVLRGDPAGISAGLRAAFPHLAGATTFRLEGADSAKVAALLKGQVVVSARLPDGSRDATGLQIPGVLDDLFAYDGSLGAVWERGVPTLRLWAPTARRVRLHVFDEPRSVKSFQVIDMTEARGVWSATGLPNWKWRYYLYEVSVYVPARRIETRSRRARASRRRWRSAPRGQEGRTGRGRSGARRWRTPRSSRRCRLPSRRTRG